MQIDYFAVPLPATGIQQAIERAMDLAHEQTGRTTQELAMHPQDIGDWLSEIGVAHNDYGMTFYKCRGVPLQPLGRRRGWVICAMEHVPPETLPRVDKPRAEQILQFFSYEHLPSHLQTVSRPFCELAEHVEATLPAGPERTVSLRKLLESKDCAVRAQTARPCV